MARTERRLVTSLFVDVVGSTDATVRLGPERMQRLLGDAFAAMGAAIAAEGGTVEKYVGDAIFALFGASVARTDDAERALRAADACARWSTSPSASEARLAVRVGIETGEALIDLDAIDVRQRIAVGAAVNLAARLQQHAEPGQVILGPTAHDATASIADFEPLGTLALKGLSDVEAWRFLGFRSDADAGREVDFVGREPELEVLASAFRQAAGGTATLALIVGPPGQGKSRLTAEAIRVSGARTLAARCRPAAESGLKTPLGQLLDAEMGVATASAVKDRISTLLGPEDGDPIAGAVNHGAGLAPDERLLAVARMEQRNTIAEAWRRYLAAVAREAPLIVWIEDVHWADPIVLRVIDHATSDLDAPLLVIATARPEFAGTAGLRPRENRVQLDLQPLDERAAESLARAAGHADVDATRAAGNPLFIIELARARAGSGELPVTLHAAIAARIDELSEDERELLQRTSVAGETFDVRDATLLGEREPAAVAGALGRMAHLGFVAPVDSRYRFAHELIREVAYGRLPVAERMALHARYAEEGVDSADVEALADHWWEALKPPDGQWVWEGSPALASMRRAAFDAHLAAGRRLEARNAYEEAADVYARAIQFAPEPIDRAFAETCLGRAFARQGRGDDAWEHRQAAIAAFGEAGVTTPADLYADQLELPTQNWGYFQHVPADADVRRLLDEGERTARASGDDVSLARLLVEGAMYTEELARVDEVVRLVESADAVRFADAGSRLAQLVLWDGQVSRARELYDTIFDRLIPAGAVINEPEGMVWHSLAVFHEGELDRGEAIADRLLEESTKRSAHTQQHALALKAALALFRGDWARLTTLGEDMTRLVDANPDASFCIIGAGGRGYAAAAGVLTGTNPDGIDAAVARMVPESTLIQAASAMLPKVMAGDSEALAEGLSAYAPGLHLQDRERPWDFIDLMPAVTLTMLERWDDLGATLARLDKVAAGGSRLAGATAAAVREEIAAARGGPAPAHKELRDAGYLGVSELLRFRPIQT